MTDNVGALDGEATLSEIHERERLLFEAAHAHQSAVATNILADAGISFAKAEIYKAITLAINIVTAVGAVAGVRALVKWW
jgi:hypothetical protein